ncbi:MAG TPA: hypothetical protein VE645_08350 [Pseudonocardiaceae bacterium]|nr:hypothetical protein [Pseudonocardiaceae bacterium]
MREPADPRGLAISERLVDDAEVGDSPRHLHGIALGVVRWGEAATSTGGLRVLQLDFGIVQPVG